MNAVISDPDTKINMSLDEIIRLSRNDLNANSRRKKRTKKKSELSKSCTDHSVPLLTSSEGVSIFVSKKSPLLTPEIKTSFLKAVRNRSLNAELLRKSSRIIPAKYKLIKTDNGVERILVPVKNYVCKPLRKLHHATTQRNHFFNKKCNDEIPPLLSVPVSKPTHSSYNHLNQSIQTDMDVDDSDDVIVINPTIVKKEPELIDVELNMPVRVLENEKSTKAKTLNDRFTRLTGQLQF